MKIFLLLSNTGKFFVEIINCLEILEIINCYLKAILSFSLVKVWWWSGSKSMKRLAGMVWCVS